MGFHPIDWVIPLIIALLFFGPKTIQSISRDAGKSVGQAKNAKDKLLAQLPMEDLNQVRDTISRIPMSPQQAVSMLLLPEQPPAQDAKNNQDATPAPTQKDEAQVAK